MSVFRIKYTELNLPDLQDLNGTLNSLGPANITGPPGSATNTGATGAPGIGLPSGGTGGNILAFFNGVPTWTGAAGVGFPSGATGGNILAFFNGAPGWTGISGIPSGATGGNVLAFIAGALAWTGVSGLPSGATGGNVLSFINGVPAWTGALGFGLPTGATGGNVLSFIGGVPAWTGIGGVTGPTGPGGALAYGFFYGLTVGTDNAGATEYAATIAGGVAFNFAHVGAQAGGVAINNIGPLTTQTSNTDFLLPNIGTYEISFNVHTTEPGQIQANIGDGTTQVVVPGSLGADMNPTAGGHLITQRFMVTTTLANRILRIVNPVGNTPPLTVTPADGSQTHANTPTLNIVQID